MRIKNYNELNSLELDTLREVGSIGTGNAPVLAGEHGESLKLTHEFLRPILAKEAIPRIDGGDHLRHVDRLGDGHHLHRAGLAPAPRKRRIDPLHDRLAPTCDGLAIRI